jgi:biopolymer transport protein ExbB
MHRTSISNLQFAICNLQCFVRVAALACVLVSTAPSRLCAQEQAAAKSATGDDKAPEKSSDAQTTGDNTIPDKLWELFVASGTVSMGFMGFLGLISLAASVVVLERLAHLTRGRVVPSDLVRDLAALVQKGESRVESFVELARRGTSPLANILRAGLVHAGGPVADVETSMECAAAREMAELRARLRPLSLAATLAPLVGMLGTLVAMIDAYHVTRQVQGSMQHDALTDAVYRSLGTTAVGLAIAIGSLLFLSYFQGRGERLFRQINESLTTLLPALKRMELAGGTKGTGGNPLMASR